MNEYMKNDQGSISDLVEGTTLGYQRNFGENIVNTLKDGFENKYVRAGMAGVASICALAACGPAYAGEAASAAVEYGFFSGAWDGIVVVPNIVLDLLGCESTLASDGSGIRSDPNNGLGYWLGFYMTAGVEGTLFGVIGGSGDD